MRKILKKTSIFFLAIFIFSLSSCNFNIENPFYIPPVEENVDEEPKNDNITPEEPDDNGGKTNTNEGSDSSISKDENNSSNSTPEIQNPSTQEPDNSTTLEGEITDKYDVHFIFNNGEDPYTISILSGTDYLVKPDNPTKEGFIFDCWCNDEDLTEEYDFSTDITSETYIYAKYIVDYAYLTNKITTEIMSANVTIINSKYYSDSISTGSGIIFKKESTGPRFRYYALTNNHVIYNTQSNYEYSVEDYLGNEYTKSNNSVTLVGHSSSYDLAVISFITDKELTVIELDDTDPQIGDEIISLGQPLGQTNSITYGKITKYCNVTTNGTSSNISFAVASHDSYLNNGSSGGALLNTELKLVGINFGGVFDSDDNFTAGYAVQITKVKEFLNLIV